MSAINPKLKSKLKELPHKPGVYKYLNKDGEVIYVGKAKDLRNRIMQYFSGQDTRTQLPFLMAEATDLDFIVVSSELEALFLENTLIKQYMPEYNIMLRDDKNYAFIKIDYTTSIPTIGYARKIENNSKEAKYFGPYSSTKKIKQTLDFVRKIFPYCANKEIGKRPCFYYYLHRCPGVCIGTISLQEYQLQIDRITLFLSGQTSSIKRELRKSMTSAANRKQFELAGRLRDQLTGIEVLDERQVTMFPQKVSWDFVSLYIQGLSACVNLFKVREGKLIDKENFIYDNILHLPEAERGEKILQTFTENYYSTTSSLPKAIYTQTALPQPSLIADLIKTRSTKKIPISTPTRGQKLKLINLGITNAQEYLAKWQRNQAVNLDQLQETLAELKQILNLPTLPKRIEGYDISNTQGTNPVGSMVVTKDGIANKSEYRKFKITVKNTPDDFSMMREMLTRRLARENPENPADKWPTPDLLVIDGGKGQLKVAVEVLKEKNLKIPVIGLAKRIEEIFLPHKSEPIILSHSNPVLQLLQRLRDEAHRFGITFHRSLRSKAATKSILDTIPGIGPKTKKLLKQRFGTISQIRKTEQADLAALIGNKKAEILRKFLT